MREFAYALLLAALRTGFCAYRGAHQSITIDEAYTFNRYLSGSWWDVWNYYEANNHVLYSILAKFSIQCFGLSELTLRLPSLLAGFFFIFGAFKILELAVQSRAIRWITLAALSLHPLLLDFSIAARGYGLGLAFLTWAIYFTMRRRYAAAGATLGLAISANLIMLFPAAGLLLAVVFVSSQDRWRNLAMIVAVAETIFVVICFGALRHAERNHFYIGEPQISEALRQNVYYSIRATAHSGLFGKDAAVRWIELLFLPAATLSVLAASARAARKERLIPLIILFICIAGILAAHFFANMNYPVDRMALHLYLLLALAWAIAADSPPRFRIANLALAALLVMQFATQLQISQFGVWSEDAHDKEIARRIDQLSASKPPESVRISTSWWHQSTLEFYRVQMHMTAVQPIAWNSPTRFDGYDFYVLGGDDIQQMAAHNIRVLFRDPNIALGCTIVDQ
jgi:hypothetical protein